MRGLQRARHQAERSLRRRMGEKETQNPAIIAKVGNGAGTVVVPGRLGWIYVRLHGDDNQLTEAKLGISLGTGSLDDAWVRVKRASPRKASYYVVEEFITSSTGDPTPPLSDHTLDPGEGPHVGTLPEDDVAFDDVSGHDHQGVGSTGKKLIAANVISDPPTIHRISVSSGNHDNYGLSYPTTYIFNIPPDLTSGKVYYRFSEEGAWVELLTKTADDFFNGIDAVRFDYDNDKAYVSVAFSSTSDDVYLKFTDAENIPIECSFSSIAAYYDDRKAVVVLTADDWTGQVGRDADFQAACDACQSRSIWITVGIMSYFDSTPPNWTAIQAELDQGYVEAASHSRTHPHIPYGDYVAEIDTSRVEIESNLDLPGLYKKGSDEYVPAWTEPFGESDAAQRSQCGVSKYLADRDVTTDHVFATWDPTNGLYNRIGYSIWMGSDGTTNLATLNASFDARYAAGEIYHLFFHPYNVDWTPGEYATQHLDHIKGKKDVWYVGFGALYLYHYVQERNITTVIAIEDMAATDVQAAINELYAMGETTSAVQIILANRTGGQRTAGDVVVTDPDNDESFIGTTVVGCQAKVLVVAETIANLSGGLCWERGGPFDVKVINAVSRNDPLRTSATIYRAAAAPSMTGGGVFAIALSPNISGEGTIKAVFLDAVGGGGGGDGVGTIEIQEDDAKVADADVVNFEGGGGKVTDEGGGKVTVDITPGAGGGAWTLIEDIELGAPAATIDFQNIPATYKHLHLIFSLRTDRAASEIDVLGMRFNNSAVGYDWVRAREWDEGTAKDSGLNDTEIEPIHLPATNSQAGSFGAGTMDFPDYLDTGKMQAVRVSAGMMRSAAAVNFFITSCFGQWRTTDAITRITLLVMLGTNFVAGSRATLYGIN